MRRGPEKGYISDAKEQYRQSVWNSFPEYVSEYCRDIEDCYVLLLPSKEGEEIQTALNKGIPEEKIICVDENPALIAVSDWRKKYPKCKFYGCKVSDVGERLNKDGRKLIAANLDLCNNFSSELIYEAECFLEVVQVYDGFCFAVTIAKGRENKATYTLLDIALKECSYYAIEDKRARVLVNAIGESGSMRRADLLLFGQGSYVHNRTPMTWVSIGHARTKDIEMMFHEMDEKSKALVDAYNKTETIIYGEYPPCVDIMKQKESLMKAHKEWDNSANDFNIPSNLLRGRNFDDKYVFESFINKYSKFMVEAAKIESKAWRLAR